MRAVTFDCWNTLLYEEDPGAGRSARAQALARAARAAGREVDPETAEAALVAAIERHVALWQECVASGASEMSGWALEALGVGDPALAASLAEEVASLSLEQSIGMLEGARTTLERLASRGVRRALVCDTGFSPGSVVRSLLDRHGLLELLEVCVFSNEAGLPKPDPSLFHAALEPLGVEPKSAVHVGDLRRTDIAGARGVGMGTVRIRDRHDDTSECPEADAVVDSHADLLRVLLVD